MKTKFLHLRKFTKKGQLLAKGGMTIAYVVNDNDHVIGMASAQCHEHDVYSKQQGRAKAEGRLKSQSYYKEIATVPEFQFIRDWQTSRYHCVNLPAPFDREVL